MERDLSRVNKILVEREVRKALATIEKGIVTIDGEVDSWNEVVQIGHRIENSKEFLV